jgi:signal transduction histidine kinase
MNLGVASFGSSRKRHLPDETSLQRLLPLSDLLANVLAREKSDRELQISRGNAQQLARKLLTAQEDERRRLAREMHDDITQRLAAASIACGQLRNDESLSQTSRSEMADLSESLIKISKDVHQFSRRLHPSILEELGLLDAIRYECNMVKAQGDIRLTIRYGNLPDNLPKELQLCLYRVAQESLRNMAKHSRASEGEIVLSADAESIRLQVNDNGVGLTATRDREQPGLGLIAMEERVLLVGGSIEITSHAGPGTCIDVRLPLAVDEPEPPETS